MATAPYNGAKFSYSLRLNLWRLRGAAQSQVLTCSLELTLAMSESNPDHYRQSLFDNNLSSVSNAKLLPQLHLELFSLGGDTRWDSPQVIFVFVFVSTAVPVSLRLPGVRLRLGLQLDAGEPGR